MEEGEGEMKEKFDFWKPAMEEGGGRKGTLPGTTSQRWWEKVLEVPVIEKLFEFFWNEDFYQIEKF